MKMAKENITKFFDTAMTDKVLAKKLAVLAVENGYDFTAEELLEFGVARPIPDNDAEKIHGGTDTNMKTGNYNIANKRIPQNCPHRRILLPRPNCATRLCTYFPSCSLAGSCDYVRNYRK